MSKFKIVSLTSQISERIRQSSVDDFGHPLENSRASAMGYGPCRCCLRQTLPGENRLLFSYAPVASSNAYNEVGPVFIHAEQCQSYTDTHNFPPEIKAGRLHIPLVLRAYSAERRMISAVPVGDNQQVESYIEKLFDNPMVAFIHVRNAEVQCFICEINRA